MDELTCRICSGPSTFLFHKKVLEKYEVGYYRCKNCSFVQTEEPYWLKEAYSNTIVNEDIGLVNRNIKLAPFLQRVINTLFDPDGRFLDFGGGYGLLTRIMRDKGYDFYHYDSHCENLFARQFEVHDMFKREQGFKLITCLEVLEHMKEPVGEIEAIYRYTDSIFFSTEIVPKDNLIDWWYFMPKAGQHISLFSLKSLSELARRLKVNFYTNNYGYHLFTKCKISPFVFRILFNPRIFPVFDLFFKGPPYSLLEKDFEKLQKS